MGTDKALLEIDGEPLAGRAAHALRAAGAEAVAFVGGDRPALLARCRDDVAFVPDRWPGEGPLGGVLTALAWSAEPATVVVSCDLHTPDAAAISAVVDALSPPGALAAVPLVDGRRQWLHSAWRDASRTTLLAAFEAGERAIHRAVAARDVRDVRGISAAAVRDVDTPRDL
jgi:molybdopterin-guanine dinucleotide biosynthesis protein A